MHNPRFLLQVICFQKLYNVLASRNNFKAKNSDFIMCAKNLKKKF